MHKLDPLRYSREYETRDLFRGRRQGNKEQNVPLTSKGGTIHYKRGRQVFSGRDKLSSEIRGTVRSTNGSNFRGIAEPYCLFSPDLFI